MDMIPDDLPLPNMVARLDREKQANTDLQMPLDRRENISYRTPNIRFSLSCVKNAGRNNTFNASPTICKDIPEESRRFFSALQVTFLVVLTLLIGGSAGTPWHIS